MPVTTAGMDLKSSNRSVKNHYQPAFIAATKLKKSSPGAIQPLWKNPENMPG
jgi:hypothetical protein